MLITVSLSVEEFKGLEQLAQDRAWMDSETLLRCFVGDLLNSDYTGGSDERMFAHQWLDRRFGNEWFAREYRAMERERKRKAQEGDQN